MYIWIIDDLTETRGGRVRTAYYIVEYDITV